MILFLAGSAVGAVIGAAAVVALLVWAFSVAHDAADELDA